MKNEARFIKYIQYVNDDNVNAAADFVETLSHAERIVLRDQLEASQCPKILRNLYYDYKTQSWID